MVRFNKIGIGIAFIFACGLITLSRLRDWNVKNLTEPSIITLSNSKAPIAAEIPESIETTESFESTQSSTRHLEFSSELPKTANSIKPSPTNPPIPHRDCSKTKFDKVDCTRAIDGFPESVTNAINWNPERIPQDVLLEMVSEKYCPKLRSEFCFPHQALSKSEEEFPLAFVMIVNKEPEQIFKLMEAIYWPQNYYCFTYDTKADPTFRKIIDRFVANCGFDNVIMAEKHEYIEWGRMGVLKAAVNSLSTLRNHVKHAQIPWKYAQILSWSDFPLKTNAEMVEILKTLNGSNDAELSKGQGFRFNYHTEYTNQTDAVPSHWANGRTVPGYPGKFYIDVSKPKAPPPGNKTVIYKGSFAATMSYDFVRYVLDEEIPQSLLKWSEDTIVPDEQYWTTLIHNPQLGAPGPYPGKCLGRKKKAWISRFQIWPGENAQPCEGSWSHGSCIFGLRDVRNLRRQPHLIAHKFYSDFQPAGRYCLAQWHHNKTYSRSPLQHPDLYS